MRPIAFVSPSASGWSSFAQLVTVTVPLARACDLLAADAANAVLQIDTCRMTDDPEAGIYAGSAGAGRMKMPTLIPGQGDDATMAKHRQCFTARIAARYGAGACNSVGADDGGSRSS